MSRRLTTRWCDRLRLLTALGACTCGVSRADFQGSTHLMPFEEDAIHYGKSTPTGPVARLQQQMDQGQVQLARDDHSGYLLSVLRELKISTNSQLLVFSKTSFQRERINPWTPRALYFNDEVYVGYIPGSPLLEVSMADPRLGGVFYTLDQKSPERPKFVRTDQCLECHASAKTVGVPGHLVRSFAVDDDGVVDLRSGTSQVNDRTPFAERWGGWYVTGTHGTQSHRGNLFGAAAFARHEKEPAFGGNVTDLRSNFDTTRYLSPASDLVALMVLEHQTHLQNLLTRLNYEATLALKAYGHVNYLKAVTESILKYLLFAEAAPLSAPIRGTTGFAEEFAAAGPRDRKGRSLRDFDLHTRLFKYPCSYLIYSDSFDSLPTPMKERFYRRLYEVLTGQDVTKEFAGISPESKRAILEILLDTRSGLPDYWRTAPARPPRSE